MTVDDFQPDIWDFSIILKYLLRLLRRAQYTTYTDAEISLYFLHEYENVIKGLLP